MSPARARSCSARRGPATPGPGPKRTNKRKGGGVAFARRNRDYRYSMPKKAVRTAIRMALLSKFQDQQAIILDNLGCRATSRKPRSSRRSSARSSRPDLGEGQASSQSKGETKVATLSRSARRADRAAGPAASDPTIYRSARNIPGVKVAPVVEFNTYDILRQKYLILTRRIARRAQRAGHPKRAEVRRAASDNGAES